jgi:hypothetical protein
VVAARKTLLDVTTQPEWLRERVLALTASYITATELAEKTRLRALLEPAYTQYIARFNAPPPDLAERGQELRPKKATSLDVYLDRQFEVHYDREYMVGPTDHVPAPGRGTRLVIGEFSTGVH